MKSSDVKVGEVYTTKVGIRSVDVRIERENPKGGFDATSVASGKPIRIKDAARLKPAKEEATTDSHGGEAQRPAKAPKRAKQPKAAKAPKQKSEKEPGKMSCLDAAAAVLKEAGEPLQTKAMIDRMHAKGLWSSDAPTPAATLYSAILREMKTKRDKARFKKTDRGHFALNA
jgi:hypothetical protein